MRQLEVDRGLVAGGRVAAFRVVVVLDVVADGVVRFGARFESAAVYELFLECREEALRDSVVVAVAGRAHAAARAVLVEHAAVLLARVLTTAVGMVDEPRLRSATGERMVERRHRQVAAE